MAERKRQSQFFWQTSSLCPRSVWYFFYIDSRTFKSPCWKAKKEWVTNGEVKRKGAELGKPAWRLRQETRVIWKHILCNHCCVLNIHQNMVEVYIWICGLDYLNTRIIILKYILEEQLLWVVDLNET